MASMTLATPQHVHRGGLRIHYRDEAITAIDMLAKAPAYRAPANPLEASLHEQFEAYFADAGFRFELPLRPAGTDFQQRVWQALRAIPAGRVRRYGELAEQLHSSARAVGNACRRNPIPIVVPCHRVVARSGIGGFGGAVAGRLVDQKRRLLSHEGLSL